jgi:NADPH2:quinone reductase
MPGFAKTPSASTRCNGRNCRRPQPKAGEVLVEIKAASLNFPDLLIVQNKYQMKPPCPSCPARNTPASSQRSAKASRT